MYFVESSTGKLTVPNELTINRVTQSSSDDDDHEQEHVRVYVLFLSDVKVRIESDYVDFLKKSINEYLIANFDAENRPISVRVMIAGISSWMLFIQADINEIFNIDSVKDVNFNILDFGESTLSDIGYVDIVVNFDYSGAFGASAILPTPFSGRVKLILSYLKKECSHCEYFNVERFKRSMKANVKA